MIDPGLRTHGLDSPSFARLCAMLAARDTDATHEVQVLHDDGVVVAVLDTELGAVDPGTIGVVHDARATAARLRAETGADRVVVAEVGAVRAAMTGVERRATVHVTQPELFAMCHDAFWSCDGVVADPPVGPSSWWQLADRLKAAGDGFLVIALSDESGWVVALLGRLAGGNLVELTDLPVAAANVLPDLQEVAGLLPGPLAASVVASATAFGGALAAADVASALAAMVDVRVAV